MTESPTSLQFMGHQSPTPTYQRVVTPAPDEPTLSPLPTPDNSLASPPSPLNPSSSLDRSPASQQEEPPCPTLNHSLPPLPVHSSPVIDKPVLKVQTPVSSPKKERKSSNPSTFDVSHRDTLKPVASPVTAVGEISGGDHSKQMSSQMEFLFPETPSPEGVSTGSSMENLLDTEGGEMEKEIGGSPAQSKKFKRLRKFRDRLRRRKGVEVRERKPRSKSMSKEKSAEEVEAAMDLQKRRSRSEVPLSPKEEEEEEEESLRAIHRNRRSYTMLTGHITAKYAAKKKAESVRNANRKNSVENSKKDAVDPKVEQQYESVAEVTKMSPAKFKRTFYNAQLKYKLRVALQGVHAPLSNNPVYLQQCADKDSSCQLKLLLQTALRHSRWQHSEMETALLTELLKMVDPMPNEL